VLIAVFLPCTRSTAFGRICRLSVRSSLTSGSLDLKVHFSYAGTSLDQGHRVKVKATGARKLWLLNAYERRSLITTRECCALVCRTAQVKSDCESHSLGPDQGQGHRIPPYWHTISKSGSSRQLARPTVAYLEWRTYVGEPESVVPLKSINQSIILL